MKQTNLVWTGRRFVNLDRITSIEVHAPGEIGNYETRYAGDYWGRVDFANESTVLFLWDEIGGANYEYEERLPLAGDEAKSFLREIGWDAQLFVVNERVNDEARNKLEILEREYEQAREKGEQPDASKDALPF